MAGSRIFFRGHGGLFSINCLQSHLFHVAAKDGGRMIVQNCDGKMVQQGPNSTYANVGGSVGTVISRSPVNGHRVDLAVGTAPGQCGEKTQTTNARRKRRSFPRTN